MSVVSSTITPTATNGDELSVAFAWSALSLKCVSTLKSNFFLMLVMMSVDALATLFSFVPLAIRCRRCLKSGFQGVFRRLPITNRKHPKPSWRQVGKFPKVYVPPGTEYPRSSTSPRWTRARSNVPLGKLLAKTLLSTVLKGEIRIVKIVAVGRIAPPTLKNSSLI